MSIVRDYENYEDYVSFQKQKTTDPTKRTKWLTEEWQSKIDGFKQEFAKLGDFLEPSTKALCLGARTGQEVVALQHLGVKDAIGIDIVPHEQLVVEGDVHDLQFEDNTFDLVYTNILDHSIDPAKMISEVERVLKVGGAFFLQIQLGLNQDEYTEFEVEEPILDVLPLFNSSFCAHAGYVQPDRMGNFAGMNFEYVFVKDEKLAELYEKHGSIRNVEVPSNFERLWKDINEPIQEQKLDQAGIVEPSKREQILDSLHRRAYYLTCVADVFGCKNIAEVGTAQGWQFYSFCEYAAQKEGKVYSCDPRDVRSIEYAAKFEGTVKVGEFIQGTSLEMSAVADDIEMFYIDGSHEQGSVIADVSNLMRSQSSTPPTVWVFDDCDTRFGCFEDILQIGLASKRLKVYRVGKTASGKDSHQALVVATFRSE